MKFLCENCKAKYQIADDKVAGRTVRMKCRKCAHLIEVEASVTESSVAAQPPQDTGDPPNTSSPPGQGLNPATVHVGGAGPIAPGNAPPPRPPGPPPRPPSPSRAGVPPRASGPLSGSAVASLPASGGMPVAPVASTAPARPAAPAPSHAGAGLAGAFSKSVAAPKEDPSSVAAAMSVLSSSSTTEEWYVGINGVPVGPVRLSELRRKAASGLVTEDSLVWREGFEEWVPLRTYPELCALLKEAATGRTSYLPPPPTGAGVPSRPAPSRTTGPPAAPAPARTAAPTRTAGPTTVRSNVVALSSRRATAEKIDGLEDPFPDTSRGEPQTAPVPAQAPAPLVASAEAALPPAPQPMSAAAPSVVIAEPVSMPARESPVPPLSTRVAGSRRAHPAVGLVLVLGGVLIGAVGIILISPKPAKPTVQIVSVMVPAPPPPAAEAAGTTEVGPIEVAPSSGPVAKQGGAKSAKETPGAAGSAAQLNPSLRGLGGLVGGPVAPQVAGPSTGGGGQLAAGDVERVVQTHRAFVKRQCWDSALAGRASGAPSSTRVSVQINVAPSGAVSSANATGGDGYPGLAACVQNQVTKWKFPPSEGSPVTVPFIFAAQ